MEYRLNKIDTEVRQTIQDETKEGLIHRKLGLKINKNVYKDNKNKNFSEQLKKYSENKKNTSKVISVEAEKVQHAEIEAFMDENEKNILSSGRFLDIKR
jgi:predicted CopG family antitoxin